MGKVSPALQLDFAAVTEADDTLIVGFADQQFETTSYFMLQRALTPSDGDQVYLERDGQQYCGYGTVHRCTLTRFQLELEIEDSLADALDFPDAFVVRFKCGDAVFEQLRAALPRIFSGTPCILNV